jgi:hypothetical protein
MGRTVAIVAAVVVALGALHFHYVTWPHLRAPLPHVAAVQSGPGSKSCDQVRWDWAVRERGGDERPGRDDNLWIDKFALAHRVSQSPQAFYDKLNDWCTWHPRNTLADAAIYVQKQPKR